FGRSEREFTNLLLTELPNGDFGQTMARQFLFDAYQDLLWNRLVDSNDETIAGIAGKARKESSYHLRHSRLWVLRLGDGTEESHRRMQAALDATWRFTGEMFIDDDIDRTAADAGYGVLPSTLRDEWTATVTDTISEATLDTPDDTSLRTGGREGRHSEEMGPLLAEMQYMYRSFPGAPW
ncbi:MAG: phenylacetate-CoA oxygenase subunit PaaC, partial [Acidimicrobiia bacterium]